MCSISPTFVGIVLSPFFFLLFWMSVIFGPNTYIAISDYIPGQLFRLWEVVFC